jgi:hypothetical protein
MILLAVLTIIGVSAVTLSSQERMNAHAHSNYDALVECATAAQAQLWSQVGVNGTAYYKSPSPTMTVTSLTLSDGRELASPAHLDSTAPILVSAGIGGGPVGDPQGQTWVEDTTNRITASGPGGPGGGGTWVTARCVDSFGRVHEVEFAFKFTL